MPHRTTAARVFLAALAALAPAAAQEPLTDTQGRQLFPHGFVTLTADNRGRPMNYTLEDYQRMQQLGSNFQVIRIFLGKIGGWPGRAPDPAYLDQVDRMVRLGKQVGLRSVFKLAVYDIRPFERAQWNEFWMNKAGQREIFVNAWQRVFTRFKDEPAVFGYDLLNEPIRGYIENNQVFVRDYLVPLYRQLADALHQISPEKWAIYQPPYLPPYLNPNGRGFDFGEMNVPIGRTRLAYSPHGYRVHNEEDLKRFRNEAALSKAAIFFGEYGGSTPAAADENLDMQFAYRKELIGTVTAFDRYGIGAIKPWFCGTQFTLGPLHSTWAVFQDNSAIGATERKYVLDVVARPEPFVVAGRVEGYRFDFATRVFQMNFTPDAGKGTSEIFIPMERHYPDGFRILYKGLVLSCHPLAPASLKVLRNPNKLDPSMFRWHLPQKILVVRQWDNSAQPALLKVMPGFRD